MQCNLGFPAATGLQPGTEDPGPGPLQTPGSVRSLDPERTFQELQQAETDHQAAGFRSDLRCCNPSPVSTRQTIDTAAFETHVGVENASGVREWLDATELVGEPRLSVFVRLPSCTYCICVSCY